MQMAQTRSGTCPFSLKALEALCKLINKDASATAFSTIIRDLLADSNKTEAPEFKEFGISEMLGLLAVHHTGLRDNAPAMTLTQFKPLAYRPSSIVRTCTLTYKGKLQGMPGDAEISLIMHHEWDGKYNRESTTVAVSVPDGFPDRHLETLQSLCHKLLPETTYWEAEVTA
jgi:hypothetical protein